MLNTISSSELYHVLRIKVKSESVLKRKKKEIFSFMVMKYKVIMKIRSKDSGLK